MEFVRPHRHPSLLPSATPLPLVAPPPRGSDISFKRIRPETFKVSGRMKARVQSRRALSTEMMPSVHSCSKGYLFVCPSLRCMLPAALSVSVPPPHLLAEAIFLLKEYVPKRPFGGGQKLSRRMKARCEPQRSATAMMPRVYSCSKGYRFRLRPATLPFELLSEQSCQELQSDAAVSL